MNYEENMSSIATLMVYNRSIFPMVLDTGSKIILKKQLTSQ